MLERIKRIDLPLRPLCRRFLGKILVLFVFAMMAIGLTQFAAVAPHASLESESIDPPNSGTVVRSEVIHLWLPSTVLVLARDQYSELRLQSHQDLKRVLETRGQEKTWYALTVRQYQVNHGVTDISFLRYPYGEPENFQAFMDALALIAGGPPREGSSDMSAAIVHIMPKAMTGEEWLEAMRASLLLP